MNKKNVIILYVVNNESRLPIDVHESNLNSINYACICIYIYIYVYTYLYEIILCMYIHRDFITFICICIIYQI